MSISLARVYMAVLAAIPLWMAASGDVAATDALIGTTSILTLWRFVDPRVRKTQLSCEFSPFARRIDLRESQKSGGN